MKMKFLNCATLLVGLGLMVIMSCNLDPVGTKNEKEIKNYLKDNNLHAESTSSGLYYIIDVPGNDQHPTVADTVHISYTGSLLNGDVFDSSPSATFVLGDLIEGMIEGIPLFGKGGEGTLFIPSELGYGGDSQPGIPSNSVVVFKIKLIDF
jgi:FKBP-type peptidyl-prolyl cis-trans isomerase FkpA